MQFACIWEKYYTQNIHNYEKHDKDQGYSIALKIPLRNLIRNDELTSPLSRSTINSILRVDQSQLKRVGYLNNYISDLPSGLGFEIPFLNIIGELYTWIRHMSAGLIWSILGPPSNSINWESAKIFSPSIAKTTNPISLETGYQNALFSQHIVHLANKNNWFPVIYKMPNEYPKDIFNYSISLKKINNKGKHFLGVKHVFYLSYTFLVFVFIPESIFLDLTHIFDQ